MIETLNLARKYVHVFSFRKNTFWYKGPLNFTEFAKKSACFSQNNTYTQSNSVKAVLEIF